MEGLIYMLKWALPIYIVVTIISLRISDSISWKHHGVYGKLLETIILVGFIMVFFIVWSMVIIFYVLI